MLEDWKRKERKKTGKEDMQQVKIGESAVYHKEKEEVSPGKEESVGSVVRLD